MKSLVIFGLLAVVATASVDLDAAAMLRTAAPGRITTRADVIVKVCNSSWTCSDSSECTSYRVSPFHCFKHLPGQALRFRCESFQKCVSGQEFYGNTCNGYGRNYTAPCNTCLGGRYLQCSDDNKITHYDCRPKAGHPGGGNGPSRETRTCANLSSCDVLFGPVPMEPGCETIPTRFGRFNISIKLPTESPPCKEIRVDQFFNENCSYNHNVTRAPRPPRPPTPTSALPTANLLEGGTMPPKPPRPPAPTGGRHHHHHWLHHLAYYMPDGQCIHHEDGRTMSIQFSCASSHLGADAETDDIPLAPPEVMDLVEEQMMKEKRTAIGHPSAPRPHMQPVFHRHEEEHAEGDE